MNTEQTELDALIATFASEWLRLGDPQISSRILADPIVVLGPEGTTPVPRPAFLAAVGSRSDAVSETESVTALTAANAQSLGDRVVVATISWSFGQGDTSATLVSDFLLLREGSASLRCVAYLPRTNVLNHLA